jgi:hypothetical protein
MRETLRASYRLRPDARFLRALGDLRRLLGKREAAIEARFESGTWAVREGGAPVGTLPEIPGFADGLALLTARARALGAGSASAANVARSEAYLADDAIPALAALDRGAAGHAAAPEEAGRAAALLARLAFQSADRLELADALGARALAALALAKASGATGLARDEALLAAALGYSRHAAALAASLPEGDALRLFLEHREDALEAKARASGASPEARYLWLRRIARKSDLKLWNEARARLFAKGGSLPVVATGLDLELPTQAELHGHLDDAARETVTLLEQDGLASATPGADEAFVAGRCAAAAGPFWDHAVCASYFRAGYYAAIDVPVERGIRDEEPADPLRTSRGDAGFGRAFDDYAATVQSDRRSLLAFLRDGSKVRLLGPGPVSRIATRFFNLSASQAPESPDIGEAMRLLAPALDTRPTLRAVAALSLHGSVHEFPLADALYRSTEADIGEDDVKTAAQTAVYLGDWAAVERMLRAPSLDAGPAERVLAYWQQTRKEDVERIERASEAACDRFPHDWNLTMGYVLFLRQIDQHAKSCRVLERWLARNNPQTVGWYHAHAFLSYSYAYAGEYQKGLAIVSPPDDLTLRRCASRSLNGLGRTREAEEMARTVFAQNPSFLDNAQNLAEILWQNGKVDEAAEVLVGSSRISDSEWWFEIGPAFARIYSARPQGDVAAAIAALRKHHASEMVLRGLATALERRGEHQRAFDAFSAIAPPGTTNEEVAMETFQSLQRAQGADVAHAWLKKLVPPERRNPFCVKAMYAREYELLWSFIEDPSVSQYPEAVWMMRAAAVALDPGSRAKHGEDVRRHFDHADPDPDFEIARFAVGLSSEAEALKRASENAALRCHFAYYAGAKAEGEGRFGDAAEWYRVALDTNQPHEMAYRLSFVTLRRWWESRKSLAEIAANRL